MIGSLDINRLVALSLRTGVSIGAILSLVGLGAWAADGFNAASFAPTSDIYGAIVSGLSGSRTGIVYLGVVVLIATPIFRVALSVAYFGVERDKRYVAVTLLVLAMLIFALVSGKAG
ncbi:hypothetical protein AUG19_08810 [archaeon 13_1_20CM_2_54_9]|nr:MAG: hypothetical protein AUJ07_06980 [Crenarchaeota archaeon 13_1_40CM_3_53_5]OLE74370.1 MAG: hypothetical protein AUG19_08810 [archaeon 13_1_20CM_2_54_9]